MNTANFIFIQTFKETLFVYNTAIKNLLISCAALTMFILIYSYILPVFNIKQLILIKTEKEHTLSFQPKHYISSSAFSFSRDYLGSFLFMLSPCIQHSFYGIKQKICCGFLCPNKRIHNIRRMYDSPNKRYKNIITLLIFVRHMIHNRISILEKPSTEFDIFHISIFDTLS